MIVFFTVLTHGFGQGYGVVGDHTDYRATSGPTVPSRPVSFAALDRVADYAVVRAKRRDFLEKLALVADLTPKVLPALRRTTRAVQLEYGFRKGGIGVIYEMPRQAGLDAATTFKQVLRSGAFLDRDNLKGWSIKSVADERLLIAVSGPTPAVRDALIHAIHK